MDKLEEKINLIPQKLFDKHLSFYYAEQAQSPSRRITNPNKDE